MHALIFHEPGRISVESIDDPSPQAGEVILRVGAAAVCASDLRVFRGEKHAEAGVVPGHEFAGTVVDRAADVVNVELGQRVTVYPIVACGGCEFCRRGLRNRCLARRTLGYDLNGGMAQYVRLPSSIVAQGHVVPVADQLSTLRAALTEPTACVLNSLESSGFRAGASVAVLGAGPMGLLHVVLARALGAGPIIVSEPVDVRRAMAETLGASVVTGGDAKQSESAVMDATGGQGADVVIVSVGLEGLTETALRLAAKQATVNLFAGFPSASTALLDVNALHYNEINLTGSQNATPDQFRRTVALLPSLDAIDTIATHRFDMAHAAESYSVRADPAALKTLVFPNGDGGA
jgi:L-iditol 2-dehydrogenase